MGKTLLAASAVIVTLALPQAASAATANGATLKSAIETTTSVDQAGYGYGRRYYRPYRPTIGRTTTTTEAIGIRLTRVASPARVPGPAQYLRRPFFTFGDRPDEQILSQNRSRSLHQEFTWKAPDVCCATPVPRYVESLGADGSWHASLRVHRREKRKIDLKEVYGWVSQSSLAASAVIVTLALPQAASAATANGATIKSAIETTTSVDQAGYGYGYGYLSAVSLLSAVLLQLLRRLEFADEACFASMFSGPAQCLRRPSHFRADAHDKKVLSLAHVHLTKNSRGTRRMFGLRDPGLELV